MERQRKSFVKENCTLHPWLPFLCSVPPIIAPTTAALPRYNSPQCNNRVGFVAGPKKYVKDEHNDQEIFRLLSVRYAIIVLDTLSICKIRCPSVRYTVLLKGTMSFSKIRCSSVGDAPHLYDTMFFCKILCPSAKSTSLCRILWPYVGYAVLQ